VNITRRRANLRGMTRSEKRQLAALARVVEKLAKEVVKPNGYWQFGKPLSLEHRAKISAANLGKRHSPETRAKMRAANLGKWVSPETRSKISAAQIGKRNSLGYRHSPETRANMSAAQLKRRNEEKERERHDEERATDSDEVKRIEAELKRLGRDEKSVLTRCATLGRSFLKIEALLPRGQFGVWVNDNFPKLRGRVSDWMRAATVSPRKLKTYRSVREVVQDPTTIRDKTARARAVAAKQSGDGQNVLHLKPRRRRDPLKLEVVMNALLMRLDGVAEDMANSGVVFPIPKIKEYIGRLEGVARQLQKVPTEKPEPHPVAHMKNHKVRKVS